MIFLYRFDLKDNGIDFILHEKIAANMLPYYEEMLRSLVASLAENLSFYRAFSKHPTILTGKILDNNKLEIMLIEGLGQYIDVYTKNQIIFESGKLIADILIKVMDHYTLQR
ncbi:hypothetical protein P4388_25030 [Bacillus thuringiensis]|uniref:hypothetical protein n=1 Tax=Bacillus cereus group TaxID=86661 RepID=UPI000A3B21C3|nr:MULTISPECIES: hypothetical protein [Bacillus cereus group]MEB9738506.1 hypothetical protein [Bacillus cereus]MED3351840.1 hypothetical protein [Bacillus thuringiensis]OTW84408.1 hypothetical protein BK713_08710 [Bacillus thuringiensis serovar jinghongiensis]OTW84789.1 hypothetical protein BK710_15820 [Bacillus thuringiensis serovar sumiyoshiensis]OTX08740.1 hypothetical protein BK711_02145 [Bacillus thuringiensis serovar fukuokaensis]